MSACFFRGRQPAMVQNLLEKWRYAQGRVLRQAKMIFCRNKGFVAKRRSVAEKGPPMGALPFFKQALSKALCFA
jgi:hypothetical protein